MLNQDKLALITALFVFLIIALGLVSGLRVQTGPSQSRQAQPTPQLERVAQVTASPQQVSALFGVQYQEQDPQSQLSQENTAETVAEKMTLLAIHKHLGQYHARVMTGETPNVNYKSLVVGDSIQHYVVEAIQANALLLSDGETTTTLYLFQPVLASGAN